MMLFDQHYSEAGAENKLTIIMRELLTARLELPYIMCIGTDKHILDCLGPLIGTMVKEQMPMFPLYGTLHNPLHARNITKQLQSIRCLHEGGTELVIDASVGEPDEVGHIRLRAGSIYPGKATGKKLPHVGEYALTGVVKSKQISRLLPNQVRNESLAMVYTMARIISLSLLSWYKIFTEDL